MIILTDVDGVLLNWNSAFEYYMGKEGYKLIGDQLNRYSLSKRFGVSREAMNEYINEFNNSKIISRLEPFKDAKKYVLKLVKDGFRFIAITNIGDSSTSYEYRKQNLISVFGDIFDDIICLPVGTSKYEVLSRWEDTGLFWIEDKFSNALDGHSVGLNSILIDADYNKDFSTTRFPRVSGETPWEAIYDMITEYYSSP